MRWTLILLGAFGLVALVPSPAWAYIDPGTSSAAYQVLLAGVLAVGWVFRGAWNYVARFIGSRQQPSGASDSERRAP